MPERKDRSLVGIEEREKLGYTIIAKLGLIEIKSAEVRCLCDQAE